MGRVVNQTYACGLVLLLAVIALSPASASGFCGAAPVPPHSAWLERMPALRAVPQGGSLPFGPRGIQVIRGSQQRTIMVPASAPPKAGFSLVLRPSAGKPGSAGLELNWLITAKLTRVDARGKPRRLLGWQRARIAALDRGRGFFVVLPRTLGFYRLQIVFRDGGGKRLGRFGEYLRMSRPITDPRLTLSAPSYRPGETISACLRNDGTTTLSYGLEPLIESYEGGAWHRSPIDLPRPVTLIASSLFSGEASQLGHFTIPPDAPPGRYRWVWEGRSIGAPQVDAGAVSSAEFQILRPV